MEWHPKLYINGNKDLGYNFNYDINGRDMIVSQWGVYPKFAKFNNLWELYEWMNRCNQDHLFEVIPGEKKQKPYYDIDINNTPPTLENLKKFDRMIDNLVNKLDSILNGITHKCDILVFKSHRSDKLSYHVVIDGIYVESNFHNRVFCDMHVTDEIRPHYDKLYSSLQQFRLYGCSKYGKNNKKVKSDLSLCLIPKKEKFRDLYIYTKSLVTDTEKCELFPIDLPDKLQKRQYKTLSHENYYVNKALFLLDVYYPQVFDVKSFKVSDSNMLIELVSRGAYTCLNHKREHEHENAFMVIEKRHWGVCFDCRREGKSKFWIGNIHTK